MERMHQTMQGLVREIQLDPPPRCGRGWLVRDAGLNMLRAQPRNGVRQTAFERISRKQHDGEIMEFSEVAMGRNPHDTGKRSEKLDSV